MAPDIHAIKEIEELKTEIAIDAKPKEKSSAVAEAPSGEGTIGISLIDLAEILDQHKQWVESGGETGNKADLCGINLSKADLTGVNLQAAHLHRVNLSGADLSMANLRGASLVRANLQNTNLLGTELRGANLMGANVYGADGLWFGRLGGTNLFDAVLPESISAMDSSKAIGDATKVARWFYFLTVGLSLVCCLLIAYTNDVRLLINSSALPFAKLGNLLPMTGLYLGGPIVLLILSLRFHFLLLRLWGSMAALPAVFPDGQTLEKDGPWYLMGLVRRHFRWQGEARAAMTAFESVLSTLLAYWIVPATLFFFWLRYLTRQDFRGTLLHVFLMTIAVATATSVPFVVSRVLRPGDIRLPKSKNILRMILGTTRAALAVGCILFVISLGVNRGLPSDRTATKVSPADPRRWAATVFQSVGYRPYADLTEASLSTSLPKGTPWTDENIAKIQGAHLNEMNLRYARAYHAFLVNAKLWRANLEGIYLSEGDLRGANMRETLLRSGIFDRAQLSHAVLVRLALRCGFDQRATFAHRSFAHGHAGHPARARCAFLRQLGADGPVLSPAGRSRSDGRAVQGNYFFRRGFEESGFAGSKFGRRGFAGSGIRWHEFDRHRLARGFGANFAAGLFRAEWPNSGDGSRSCCGSAGSLRISLIEASVHFKLLAFLGIVRHITK